MIIFLFHNDLRLYDNTGLKEALELGETLPVFIFTPEQLGPGNKYRSQNCVNFMCESLKDLDLELRKHKSKLHTYYGTTHLVIEKLIRKYSVVAVYSNSNYTPFAKKRDKKVQKVCEKHGVEFEIFEDFGLLPIGDVQTSSGVYKKFTPYYDVAKHRKIRHPEFCKLTNLRKISGPLVPITRFYRNPTKIVETELMAGGRKNGLKLMHVNHSGYDRNRNMLAINTTGLSAYIKFGCISVREVYWSIPNKNGDLVKQLFWREFFMNIVHQYPGILDNQNWHRNFNQNYNRVAWRTVGDAKFKRWCDGKTGYPVVDAAMRQLNQIGWMHNRGRLIVSAFLVKLLGYHWELGERYFATKLRDYDPAQNNGGWQFVAGSGVDAQPYFRMFNPWLQSEKYDPQAKYIKKWVPELAKVAPKDIHKWYETCDDYDDVDYPEPMVEYDHDATKKIYSKLY